MTKQNHEFLIVESDPEHPERLTHTPPRPGQIQQSLALGNERMHYVVTAGATRRVFLFFPDSIPAELLPVDGRFEPTIRTIGDLLKQVNYLHAWRFGSLGPDGWTHAGAIGAEHLKTGPGDALTIMSLCNRLVPITNDNGRMPSMISCPPVFSGDRRYRAKYFGLAFQEIRLRGYGFMPVPFEYDERSSLNDLTRPCATIVKTYLLHYTG